MGYFDEKASTWDDNPATIERAKAISGEIINSVPLSEKWHVLEYGCGTGTLSFFLCRSVASLVLADDSTEMLKVLEKKILDADIRNMHPLKLNLMEDRYAASHDFIYTQMALHHIKDTGKIIGKFHDLLKSGGYLAIADLVEEDGSFHEHHDHYEGHNGFNTDQLKRILESAGFADVTVKVCFEMEKKFADGEMRRYPIFLMIGRKI